MAGNGVLSFKQFIGGADQLILKQDFPSSQSSLIYNYEQDISGWTFSADFQTIVVDSLAYDRYTGDPNFANSTVIGSFPKQEITGPTAPAVIDAASGTVKFTIPADMYTGPIIPDARKNVPICVLGFTWTTSDSPTQTQTHRWAVVQSYEPDVELGDPTLEADYTALAT
jgi:hypothetical protein